MKRIFNHTKKPYMDWNEYEEKSYDWDLDIEEEEAAAYYFGENAENTEEYSEEAYYEAETDSYYEAETDSYYEAEADSYYEPEAEAYPVKQPTRGKAEKQRRNGLVVWFTKMGIMDRIITTTGVAVLVLALVTGSLYVGAKFGSNGEDTFVSVGAQLDGIQTIGEAGLLAVADAEQARLAAAEIVDEEERADYEENEYGKKVTVSMDMVSVLKDLKIKFTDKETGKLVSNVPFTVTVTGPDGKSSNWIDDDMDGIIYKKDLTPGSYQVAMNELSDKKYADYTFSTISRAVEVKKDIAYKKVDVKNEIKKESEINAAKEDTKKNETEVESTLKDTVTWVESTSTSNTYTEIAKNTIPDPLSLAFSGSFVRMAEAFTASVSPSSAELKIGEALTVTAQCPDAKLGNVTWSSSNPSVVSVTGKGADATIKAEASGSATISFTAEGTAVSGGNALTGLTGTCMVTVAEKGTITLDKTSETVYIHTPVTLTATLANVVGKEPIKAESSDTEVAKVEVKDRTVTVTGLKEGTATITVKYTESNVEMTAACAVTVKVHPKDNTSKKLVDGNGTQLYVVEDGKYREAVWADYYTAEKFFVKGDVKYTGWQTLGGKVYFFDASGKKMTGEQVIQGAKYTFASDGSLVTGSGTMGIDVSKWNGKIDWKAVKNSGVSYVIIRSGYRGSSQGSLIEDPKFTQNIKGATEAGLKVGIYFFTQALDEVEAVEEASMVLEQVKNYKISYPIFLDVEASGGRGDKIDKESRTAVCKAFCETIKDAGYTAGIYANKTWLTSKIDTTSLSAYKIWLAQYASSPTYTGRYDLWQYKSTGKVSGISGDVDLNLSYLGY